MKQREFIILPRFARSLSDEHLLFSLASFAHLVIEQIDIYLERQRGIAFCRAARVIVDRRCACKFIARIQRGRIDDCVASELGTDALRHFYINFAVK